MGEGFGNTKFSRRHNNSLLQQTYALQNEVIRVEMIQV